MRNKKYRPIKLWVILILVILILVPASIFLMDGWKRHVVLSCGISVFVGLIVCLTYWFEVKEDCILIRHGLSSFNKQYRLSFKTRVIMIDDIKSIEVGKAGKSIIFYLKDTSAICFQIGGYYNRTEVIGLFNKVKDQIAKDI